MLSLQSLNCGESIFYNDQTVTSLALWTQVNNWTIG